MRSFTAAARPLILLLIAVGLSACGATLTVMNAPKPAPEASYPTLKVEAATDTVEIPADARAHFEKRLNEYLFDKKSGFTPGDSLTLRYRFVQYDEGNRAMRYLVGFGAGKGTMTAEITYLDKSGTELGKVAVAGEIIMGFFGGDFDAAISAAAKKIADYTIKTF